MMTMKKKIKSYNFNIGLILTVLMVGLTVLGLFWTPYDPDAMQGSLKSLKGTELEQARTLIQNVWTCAMPIPEGDISLKKKILLGMARKNFEGTCRLLNFLIDIHVLT